MKRVALALIFLFSIIAPLRSVILGGFPFWFDPARDLLLALDNLKKITLIGPPTGIPGLFYGPYWIWLLGLPLIISRDPRLAVLIALTVPYLIIFPLLLWQFKKIFGVATLFSLWLLFIFAFDKYSTFIWNPHLAPLLFLALVVLLYKGRFGFFTGFIAGLILNFHFSFGLASIFAAFLFTLSTKSIKKILFFCFGVGLTLLPFIVFEVRHGFNQTGAFYHAVSNSMFYNSAVVGQVGLSKIEILATFQQTLSNLLQIPKLFLPIFEIPTAVWLIVKIFRKQILLTVEGKRLFWFLTLTLLIVLYLFFSSKNPIWDYHFIGVETIFLLFLGLLCTKSQFLSRLFVGWVAVLLVMKIFDFIKTPIPDYLKVQSFQSKKIIVENIYRDANGTKFIAYSYNPALYTYDYDYLFSWLGQKHDEINDAETVYLIIPESPPLVIEDFIHYRTPDKNYITASQIQTPDKTLVIKRKLRLNSL